MVNIAQDAPYPENQLYYSVPHPFKFRNLVVNSISSFFNSLRIKDTTKQLFSFMLLGKYTETYSENHKDIDRRLWFQQEPIDRHSNQYKEFLVEVFSNVYFFSPNFRKSLKLSSEELRCESLSNDPLETALTESEYIENLYLLRNNNNG